MSYVCIIVVRQQTHLYQRGNLTIFHVELIIYIFIHQVMVASRKKEKKTYIRTKINSKQIRKQN